MTQGRTQERIFGRRTSATTRLLLAGLAVLLATAGCTGANHDQAAASGTGQSPTAGGTNAPAPSSTSSAVPPTALATGSATGPATGGAATTAAPPPITTPGVAWKSAGFTPAGPAVVSGNAVLAYGFGANKSLELFAVDARTGTTLWHQPAGFGADSGSDPVVADYLKPTVHAGLVGYLRPVDATGKYAWVLADTATGRPQVVSTPDYLDGTFQDCGGTGSASGSTSGSTWCGRSYPSGGTTSEWVELDAKTGKLSSFHGDPAPFADPSSADPDYRQISFKWTASEKSISRIVDGKTRWTAKPKSSAWTNLHLSAPQRGVRLVGYFRQTPHPVDSELTVQDPTKAELDAVDEETGKVLWRLDGADNCGPDDQSGELALAVICRDSGTIKVRAVPGKPAQISGTQRRTVVGVDLRTGKTRWTYDLGTIDLGQHGDPAAGSSVADPLRGRFWSAKGPVVLDLRTGKPATAGAFWCDRQVQLPRAPFKGAPSARRAVSSASGTVAPCDVHGKPVSGVPAALGDVGTALRLAHGTATVNGRVVAGSDALTAYRIPGDPPAAQPAAHHTGTTVTGPAQRDPLPVAWRYTAMKPVEDPIVINGVAVFQATKGGGLALVGLDAKTGKQKWSVPTAISLIESTPRALTGEFDGKVVALLPGGKNSDSSAATPYLIDPSNGKRTAVGPNVPWFDRVTECADRPGMLCSLQLPPSDVIEAANGAVTAEQVILDPKTKKVTRAADAPAPKANSKTDDGETFAFEKNGLVRRVNGTTIWRVDPAVVAKASDAAAFSYGWPDQDSDVIFITYSRGSVGSEFDMADLGTIAVRRSDGKVLWQRARGSAGCLGIDFGGDGPSILCTYTGSFAAAGITLTSLTIEGIDPRTGATLWKHQVPADTRFAGYLQSESNHTPVATRLSDREFAVTDAQTTVIIDAVTGASRRPTTTDVAWCESSFAFRPPGRSTRSSAYLMSVCADEVKGNGKPRVMPSGVGVQVSDSGPTLVASEAALVAYR